ncbi:MAG TPA: DUF6768 family protein [Sedimentisphaerales bacterium]|nr:DUF6768 family protein [Sedimentisphaerales bacterium]
MDKEQIKKIIDSPPEYDESKEDTMRSWFKDAYSKKMRWVINCVYAQYIILSILIVCCVKEFFITGQTRYQIMHAAIVVCCSHWLGFISVFAWVMLQRPRNKREINRLELRIAELIETIKEK